MKAILVIDVDEKYIGAIGTEIQFINQKYNCKWELKPMPTKKKPLFDPDHCEIEKEIKIAHEIVGYNRCIDEIIGETK